MLALALGLVGAWIIFIWIVVSLFKRKTLPKDMRLAKLGVTDNKLPPVLERLGLKQKGSILDERAQASLQLAFRGCRNVRFYDGGDHGLGIYEISDTYDLQNPPPYMTVYIHLLDHQSPHMYFDNKSNNHRNRSNLPEKISKAQLVYCEGYFSDKYDLYAPVGYAIDSLVIGAPDVLDAIDRLSLGADVEVLGNQLYMIFPDEIDLPELLSSIVENGTELAKQVDDNASRYRDERAVNRANPIGYEGRRIIRK